MVILYYLLIEGFFDFIRASYKCNNSINNEPKNIQKYVDRGFTFAKGNSFILLSNGQKANSQKKTNEARGFGHGSIIKIWINFGHSRSLHPQKGTRYMVIYTQRTKLL